MVYPQFLLASGWSRSPQPDSFDRLADLYDLRHQEFDSGQADAVSSDLALEW